jgi:hypothetical protein
MKPWEPYKIQPSNKQKMSAVYHVAHLPTAKRIIEDGTIKSSLIYDKSVLNRSRISVSWLSANTWAYGSLYGTVSFAFSWPDIIEDQNFFWVEAMTDYNPTAFRLLLSERDVPSRHVIPYDPVRDDGPLRLVDGEWFWAGHLTSEFMLEDDISLRRSEQLGFEKHNDRYCNLKGRDCAERRNQPMRDETAGKLLAHTITQGFHSLDTLWKPSRTLSLFDPIETAYAGLYRAFIKGNKVGFGGTLLRPDSCKKALMGALALYDANRLDEARDLLAIIKSDAHCETALIEIVREHFTDPLWDPVYG